MLFDFIAVVLLLLAIWLGYVSIKLLLKQHWVLGWLKGNLGLLILLLTVALGMAAWDVFSYTSLNNTNISLATVSVKQLGKQQYQLTLVDVDGKESNFEVAGDQWQIDARIFQVSNDIFGWQPKPGYRLNKLHGRYYSLQEERSNPPIDYELTDTSQPWVDVWKLLNHYPRLLPLLKAVYGAGSYAPLVDGGLYDVRLHQNGLVIKPLNEPSERALKRWE